MARHRAILVLLSGLVTVMTPMVHLSARATTDALARTSRVGLWTDSNTPPGWPRGGDRRTGRTQLQRSGRTAIGIARPRSTATRTARPRQLSAADLFDDATLHDVRLFLNSKDLATLRAEYAENIYVPADIEIDGTRVRSVAVRPRGAGSRNSTKLGLRVDFDHYTTGQRFRGLAALVLDNLAQDASMMREMLSMKVFRALGEIAPRESFCRVFVNNRYQGVYALVEEVDQDFIDRNTGEWGGHLYEYHFRFPYFGEDLGPGYELYEMLFEPRSHEDETVEQLYGPIREMFSRLNQPDATPWLDVAGANVNLYQFMRVLGIETFVGEVDGILGYWGMNNFYLYRSPVTLKHAIVPWDRDNAFRLDTTSLRRGLDQNVIFQRAYAEPALRAAYLNAIERAAVLATDGGWLDAEIDRLTALIDSAAREDRVKPFSNEQFDQEVEAVRNVVRIRPLFLLDEVNRERP